MAMFDRMTARQRLRKAARQSLSAVSFADPADCTPRVLDGVWPAELDPITDETAAIADYLRTDLLRITASANEKLASIRQTRMNALAQESEEARVTNEARAFAVSRVQSTVRNLRNRSVERQQYPGVRAAQFFDGVRRKSRAREDAKEPSAVVPLPVHAPIVRLAPTPVAAPAPDPSERAESARERLQRLLRFVARQEPGLRWAIGDRDDGTTVVVTDLAHGWIPPGIELPDGVELLGPARRSGKVAALLGPTELFTAYTPGDPFTAVGEAPQIAPSAHARHAPPVEDLGWELGAATHWRDGLPRLAHTLAKAAAAGTGVVDAEVDVLRVHLDTARYQLLAHYPDVDQPLLLNCLLLAATEGLATGQRSVANYHFAWFSELSAPVPATRWETRG